MTFDIPGRLHLGTGETPPVQTVTEPVFGTDSILIIASCLIFLILAGEIFELYPTLAYSVSRWRGSLTMEHSMKTAKSRNLIVLACLIPVSILMNRFGLYSPDFMEKIPEGLHTVSIAGILILTAGFRRMLVPRSRKMPRETYLTLLHTDFNHFIAFSFTAIITTLALSVFHVPDMGVRTVLLIEAAGFWALSTAHCAQFLISVCRGFTTFLYLCGLEFMPAGFLVLSALAL